MDYEEEIGARYLGACAAFERGDVPRARRDFELLLLDEPRFAPAWDGLGSCHDASGDLGKAGECYRKAMRLDRRGWRPRFNWACALQRAGELKEAVRWLREAARLAPEERCIHQRLGECLADLGEPAQALAAFRKALEQPERGVTDAELYVAIGGAEAGRGDAEAAESAYQRACLLAPDDARVYYHWACFSAREGQVDDALRLAVRARALDRRSLAYALLPVTLALEARRWEEAKRHVEELRHRDGAARLATAFAAELAAARGNAAEARRLALEVLRLDGDGGDQAVDRALATLRSLRAETCRCQGFRIVVRAQASDGRQYYRPYVVLAPDLESAQAMVAELQEELDPCDWDVEEVEQFPHQGESLAGVYHLLLPRHLFSPELTAGED